MFFFEDDPVMNEINSTNLQYIIIKKLFGYYDVELQFDNEVNIYIGENGLGKTTILNCVYFILKKKYDKLAEINFSEFYIKFRGNDKIFNITIHDINDYNKNNMSQRRIFVDENLIEHIIDEVTEGYYYISGTINSTELDMATMRLANFANMPFIAARNKILQYLKIGGREIAEREKKGNHHKVRELNRIIDKYITQKILYFTTYRRIENDFSKLINQTVRNQESDMLIRFGMDDVKKSIDGILNLIREKSREGFNKMAGILLKQYASTNKINYKSVLNSSIDKDMLKIILDRIGNEIAEKDRDKIISLLETRDIYKEQYSYLLDLLFKLIENYDKQKIYDDKVQKFVNTCNKYFNDKQFVYNPSDLKLDIRLQATEEQKNIELMQLSSGEKQIVSLFSKLYLENDNDSILVIDEPELSLSIKWQKMLLPDIMRSGNCKLLLTVTHSPFIFENEFDSDAKEMRICMNYSSKEVQK